MQRYSAIIEYDGTNYSGMQKQKESHIKTIQGEIEKALSKLVNKQIEIDYCGRTDTGVHALNQVIHFDLDKEMNEYNILRGMNFYLVNEQIVVKKVEKQDKYFHSRFSAKKRTYLYRVLNSQTNSPLLKNRVFFYRYALNLGKMKEATNIIIGKKMDFSSFCSIESLNNCNPMKTINRISIYKNPFFENEIDFEFEAKSFLHNMIRIIVGILLEIGRCKLTKDDLINILLQKRRSDKVETAPACGLYFKNVEY